MIQRIQTLYMLVAVIVTSVCLCIPVGAIEPQGMGVWPQVYNLWVDAGDACYYGVWPLFALQLLSIPCAIAAIFLYRQRKLQAKVCLLCVALLLLWYVCYFAYVYGLYSDLGTFHIRFGACLPIVAVILYLMARRAILADERLVRSADRIR